jgi:hypothetical protein
MLNPWLHDVVPIHDPFYNRVPQAIQSSPIDVMIDPDAMSADELYLDICLSFCGPPGTISTGISGAVLASPRLQSCLRHWNSRLT